MSRFADTIVEFLDTLGVGSAIFVGNSIGGLLSIEAAARHPDRVSATLLACSGGIPLTTLRHRAVLIPGSLMLNTVLRRRPIRRAALARPLVRHAIAARILHDPRRIEAANLVEALDGVGTRGFGTVLRAGRRYDARRSAPYVRCPTLILWGTSRPSAARVDGSTTPPPHRALGFRGVGTQWPLPDDRASRALQ
jgi:pimeloyl-ACP methyl ester carboxylesterase